MYFAWRAKSLVGYALKHMEIAVVAAAVANRHEVVGVGGQAVLNFVVRVALVDLRQNLRWQRLDVGQQAAIVLFRLVVEAGCGWRQSDDRILGAAKRAGLSGAQEK